MTHWIIEQNVFSEDCFNSSGFYKCNAPDIMSSINKLMESKSVRD